MQSQEASATLQQILEKLILERMVARRTLFPVLRSLMGNLPAVPSMAVAVAMDFPLTVDLLTPMR